MQRLRKKAAEAPGGVRALLVEAAEALEALESADANASASAGVTGVTVVREYVFDGSDTLAAVRK